MASYFNHGLAVVGLGFFALQAGAFPTWPDCPDLQDSDFQRNLLISKANDPSLTEPLKMAFDRDASGNVDIYYVERAGSLKRYSGATRAITLLGKVAAESGGENGLTGIVLDPAFRSNHWVYLYYTVSKEFRISRWVVDGNTIGQEKIILKIPNNNGGWHTGGAMKFDDYGDLWITVGEHGAGEEATIPSTNDLRGCILRIHPNADAGYSIPQGNLFPAGTAKTRPEIYVMGTRNAYTVAVDPVRRWLAWGDVGPDVVQVGKGTEEYNLVKKPGFMGWPYFAGENIAMPSGKGLDPNAPVNNSPSNTGNQTLPPAIPPIYAYQRSAAMTGPIYRYDGDLSSSVKLPPHFNRKWFVTDFNGGDIKALTLDDAGTKVLSAETVIKVADVNRPVDFQQGPDGALYVLNYAGWFGSGPATSIVQIAYKGTCRPALPKLEKVSGTAVRASSSRALSGVHWDAKGISLAGKGWHRVALYEPGGKQVESWTGEGSRRYAFPASLRGNLYFLRISTTEGESVQMLPLASR